MNKTTTSTLKTASTFETVLVILVIVTVLFIWGNSMLPGSTSSDESGFVMRLVGPFLEVFVGSGNVTMYMVRKLAHFTEYFFLSAEVTLLFSISDRIKSKLCRWQRIVFPLGTGLLVAAIDETIQLFSVNRGPSVKDVLLDFSGVCTGFVIVSLLFIVINRVKPDR